MFSDLFFEKNTMEEGVKCSCKKWGNAPHFLRFSEFFILNTIRTFFFIKESICSRFFIKKKVLSCRVEKRSGGVLRTLRRSIICNPSLRLSKKISRTLLPTPSFIFYFGLHIIPRLVPSVHHHATRTGVPDASTPAHFALLRAPLVRVDFKIFSSASAPLLPVFKGFHFHTPRSITPLRYALRAAWLPFRAHSAPFSPLRSVHSAPLKGALSLI